MIEHRCLAFLEKRQFPPHQPRSLVQIEIDEGAKPADETPHL